MHYYAEFAGDSNKLAVVNTALMSMLMIWHMCYFVRSLMAFVCQKIKGLLNYLLTYLATTTEHDTEQRITLYTLASLGLVSHGAVTNGVTPIFP